MTLPHRRIRYVAVEPRADKEAHLVMLAIGDGRGTVWAPCFGETPNDAEARASIHIARVQERALKSEAAKEARRGGRTAHALKRRQAARAADREGDLGEGGP